MTRRKISKFLNNIELTGYYHGAIGDITKAHAVYYHDHWGFDASFETQVAGELSVFIDGFRKDRDFFMVAHILDKFAGCIAIDGGRTRTESARLRWFIVAPEYQGKGIGDFLILKALSFCEKAHHKHIYLWTFEGLDPARKLYERHGFSLTEYHRKKQWGRIITEQKFEVSL
jgi:GNAT superfamily N-acetyltransferase